MHLRYCALGAAPGAATVAVLALWLLLLISLLATTADCYFVPQLEALSGYLQLSPEVAGITLLALGRAGQESEIPNFKGSYLGRFPLVSADFWTSDHLSERSRSVGAFSETRARGTLTLKRR